MNRRSFLLASAAVTFAGPGLGCDRKPTAPAAPAPPTPPSYSWQFFTPAEVATLEAILARFFPEADPSGAPSFRDANVAQYVDGQLAAEDFQGLGRMMHRGFEFVDSVATRRHGGPFATRSGEVQDEILRQFQTGSVTGLKFPQAQWFATLHTFALEGYWGDPKYGGNRDEVAWKWVGINPHCAHIHGSCGG